jgi:hypothetical protein
MSGCQRCGGTGVYTWGGTINGRPVHEGPCFACVGGGEFPTWRERQERRQEQKQFSDEGSRAGKTRD